jgi:hypothetical protein
MRSNPTTFVLLTLAALLIPLLGAAEKYHADFSGAEVGKLPADVQAVTGGYKVVEFEKDKVLELPGEPLEIFGLLFGPAGAADVDVWARAWSAASGRRMPEFGIGTGDVAGFRLVLVPAAKQLELRLGDERLTSVEMKEPWRSGTWTWMRLRVAKTKDGIWAVGGKAWPADAKEPEQWQLQLESKVAPHAGRASVWAIPFSGQPIRFDDLSVEAVK